MDKNALIETGKSFGRFLWFGVLGLVVTFLTDLVASGDLNSINVVVGEAEINLSFVVLAIVTGAIKLIDRYIHKSNNTNRNGIAPKFLQG